MSRGNIILIVLNTDCTRPEQSAPFLVFPPHRYGYLKNDFIFFQNYRFRSIIYL